MIDAIPVHVAKMTLEPTVFRSGGSGDTGWAAAIFHEERTDKDGKHYSADIRWTMVARRVDGRWLVVHDHSSFPSEMPW